MEDPFIWQIKRIKKSRKPMTYRKRNMPLDNSGFDRIFDRRKKETKRKKKKRKNRTKEPISVRE